jgi:hypothetical protein
MEMSIFTLTNARSGTLYLQYLFRNNIPDCVCRHEPFFDWGNPTLFGPAIYDASCGRLDRIRQLLAKKRAYIQKLPGRFYLESSHAFLKSAYRAALEYFPEMRLIHLIRNPLKVAKSEAYREMWRRRVHAPFHFYTTDDGQRFFYWSLTGREKIFEHFAADGISLFQRYLIQWIEIENRAMQFLEQHQLYHRCFTLHSPNDLNDETKVHALFDFLGLSPATPKLRMSGRHNKNLARSTIITPEDEHQCAAVLERLPARYLDIFRREPYLNCNWRGWPQRFVPIGMPNS